MSIDDDDMTASRQRNAERKREHPTWPRHINVFYPPGAPPQIIAELVPVRRAHLRDAYCKYCYEHHSNWWLMDQRDYQIDGLTIVLCGKCEHTSAAEEQP